MKKVSVIMPTYKREIGMISNAVGSVLGQSYENIELVVVDDSPEDFPHREEVGAYLESLKDDRILYIKNEKNLGGALARNEGIKRATGDYITFLDDDDMYLEDKVKNQVKAMEAGSYDMTFTNLVLKNLKGQVVDVRTFHDIKTTEGDEFIKYHLLNHATGTPTFMYRAEVLRSIGGFDDAIMGQEFYLMLKTIESGARIGYLDLYDTVAFRHSGESISSGMGKIKGEKILQDRKEEYFYLFNNKEKRFIRMRHRLVLSLASYKNGLYFDTVKYFFASFFTAPLQFIKLGLNYLKVYFKENRKITML